MTTSATATAEQPLELENLQQLRQVVTDFNHEQLLWSSGYLAGLAAATGSPAALPAVESDAAGEPWHILYATETGNSRHVAEMLAERARDAGLAVSLHDLRDYKARTLTRAARALFVVATHGVGDAPDGSEQFFEFWLGERAPRLENLSYSVLALGDSSYADYCVMGQRLDRQLQSLGATPLTERVDCDVDFDTPASAWAARVVAKASEEISAQAVRPRPLRAVRSAPSFSRRNPYPAELLSDQPITAAKSSKAVHHIELSIEGSGFSYLPGDSLGVVPRNPLPLVDAVLSAVELDPDDAVEVAGEPTTLARALTEHSEITVLSRQLLETLAADTHPSLRALLDDRDALARYFRSRQVIDVVNDYPMEWTAQSLLDSFRRLTPRLYSIASGPEANPGEVHLTVGRVRYEAYGRDHWGAASTYLTDAHDRIPVYVERNDHFRLPADGDTPIIMIGAGTGVAPYRAFVEHRAELGQQGRNWLIFGDRNFSSDFLYQLEWLRYRKNGLLSRLDVAFSRDQKDKLYVQHRLRQHGAELWRWLQDGAHVYVCGDADHMAVDVHEALQSVLRDNGGLSSEQAANSLTELKAAGRYQRDVY